MTNYGGPRRFSSPPTAQELERLVSDLADLFEAYNLGAAPRLRIPLGVERDSFVVLKLGAATLVDTTGGRTIRALLPEPDARFAGSCVCLIRVSAAGSIRVVPTRDSTIDGLVYSKNSSASSYVLPEFLGAYLFLFDGRSWRTFSVPLRASDDAARDTLSTVDGAITWASRAPRPLDTTYSPIACYQFTRGAPSGVDDVSGNGLNLTVSAGTARYTWMHPGIQGFLFDGATELIYNAFAGSLAITGDMSAIWIGTILSFPAAGTPTLFAHGASGELQAANILYGEFQNFGAGSSIYTVTYSHEHTAGVDQNFVAGTAWAFPNVITCFGFRRESNVIQHFNQGYPWHSASATLTAPDGGGSGRFRVGGFSGGSFFSGMCASLAIYDRALTDDEFLERYNYTLGPAFGRKG